MLPKAYIDRRVAIEQEYQQNLKLLLGDITDPVVREQIATWGKSPAQPGAVMGPAIKTDLAAVKAALETLSNDVSGTADKSTGHTEGPHDLPAT